MPAFDLVVLGCGGGPDESNLSSYLLKLHRAAWSDGIVSLDAGSGIGTLSRLLAANPALFGVPGCTPAEVLSWIRSYLITHAHMDHINGLILAAGSLSGRTRRIHAVHQTLKDIETVFSDRLWPNLATWNAGDDAAALLYSELRADNLYAPVAPGISVRTMPLSHGQTRSGTTYDSAAFFVQDDASGREFLFFGDVEPDRISRRPRTLAVWRAAARKIPHTLSTIFVECSYPLGRPDHLLYGHLNPEHLAAELGVLAAEVVAARKPPARANTRSARSTKRGGTSQNPQEDIRGALTGVRVFIAHCKEDLARAFDQPINRVIASQVRGLVAQKGLGAEILAVEQGMHIII